MSGNYQLPNTPACGFHCIKIKDFGVKMGVQTIIEDVNIHVHCGEITAIIGKNGAMIKKIGVAARKDMESLLGNKIYLTTFVKVEEDWRNSIHRLKEYGYNNND